MFVGEGGARGTVGLPTGKWPEMYVTWGGNSKIEDLVAR
jgi:hypothetical protein